METGGLFMGLIGSARMIVLIIGSSTCQYRGFMLSHYLYLRTHLLNNLEASTNSIKGLSHIAGKCSSSVSFNSRSQYFGSYLSLTYSTL
jgi:hypothetical protein